MYFLAALIADIRKGLANSELRFEDDAVKRLDLEDQQHYIFIQPPLAYSQYILRAERRLLGRVLCLK